MSLKLMSAAILSTNTSQSQPDNPDNLLKQLLECVQDCQKRYGGKHELATDFDACVVGLCVSLEAIFLHGLKHRSKTISNPVNINLNETLKQVTNIVSQSLNIGQENLSFWPFIEKHLTKHELERYNLLKHIWTDTGRGKAWLRSTLNEKSLERYIKTLLTDKDTLSEYYESWAVLRDEEKNSLLPDMAAGLGSILFAINIDKPELNSAVIPRPGLASQLPEPIIEAPLPENQDKKKDKKRKVARQFISFDDNDSMLSTSVPSISSSTSSDGYVSNYDRKSLSERAVEVTDKVEDVEPINRQNEKPKKLSMEISGNRDRFSTNAPPGTLTPVIHSDIGELTPVSVERINDFSPDVSDEILEVPTDISAVLEVVENRNQEELRKRDDRIDALMKENDNLKDQIKRYVNAIKSLKRDEESMQKALHGLQLEQHPDYQEEAKLYEKKLVQVAEMHAELMDFNISLQEQLCKKDTLLERLKSELEELRGPMSSDDLTTEDRGSVNVWIPSAFLTGSGSSAHHVYQIFLRAGNDEWNIYRRYAQFYALHTDLKKLDPEVGTFDFPPKKSIGKKDAAIVEDRRRRLQIYLRRVIAHWPELAHCNNRFLLEQHLAFFKDKREEQITRPRRSGNNSNYSGL